MTTEGYQPRSGRRGCALLLVVLVLLGFTMCGPSSSDKARWAADRAAAPFHIVALSPGKSLCCGPVEFKGGVYFYPETIDDFAAAVDGDLASYRRLRLTTDRRTSWTLSFQVPYDGKPARQVDPEMLTLGEETAFARDIAVRRVLDSGGSKLDDFKGFPGDWILGTDVFYDPVVDAYYGCRTTGCTAQFVAGRYMVHFGFYDPGETERRVVRKVIGDVRRALPRWEAVPKSAWCRKDDGCG
jgi:hypothetical protein